ncbi:hypothetical protein Tco_0799998 [Tanacetum coccineum]|uniref:Uncharacterized protein n=1 Tax=Tanacetum coccineum TaxID=301880 RepID=A0ABQ4ZRW4_9ASTR
MEAEESDDPDDIAEIFKIKGNLFDYETPLCKTFNDFNYLLKIDTDLFTFDIQGIKTYEEYELNNIVTRDLEGPWLDNGDHKWYDELVDGKLKEETLIHKVKVEESWGDATPDVMKFSAWLKSSFENFHELDYNVLVKLQECCNYGVDNVGYAQDNQEHKKEHHDPSTCRVRRFEMIKYPFDAEDEYVAIKEHDYEALLRPTPLPEYPTRDFTMSTSSLQAEKTVYTSLTGKEERSLINTSFLDEYECYSLALESEGRDEKKRLDHLKQDQEMLVIMIFSERKKVFKEKKKCEKIRAKRSDFQQGIEQYL